jgi:hypothetical protein
MQMPLWLLRKLTIRNLRRNPNQDIRAISFRLQLDEEVILLLIKARPENFSRVSAKLYNDLDFSRRALMQNDRAYEFASNDMHANKSYTIMALQFRPSNLRYAAPELLNDKDVVMAAIKAETFMNSPPDSSPSFDMASAEIKANSQVVEVCRHHIEWKQAKARNWSNL